MTEEKKKKTILFVDDEDVMRRVLESKLNSEGVETKTVSDYKQFFDTLEKEDVDLIVLDLLMPDLNGFDIMKDLQSKDNKIPVAVLSLLNQESDVAKAQELGAVEYMVKDQMTMNEIAAKIKDLANG